MKKLLSIEIEHLDLDPENPRLPLHVGRTQEEMFAYLAKTSSVDELMSAISENDFFEGEALIGVDQGNGRFLIVEGNRRLTVLKLLSGQDFEDMPKRLIEHRDSAKFRPKSVPVAVYEDRAQVLRYLGNRHIAGVKPWGALAKARYIAQFFEALDAKIEYSERCRLIARMIGSRRDFISKTIKAYRVYRQAEEKNFFDLPNLDEDTIKFSFITTAVDYEGVSNFLYGEDSPDEADPLLDRTHELFDWLFVPSGEGGKPRIGESRNLIKLSKVLASKEGLDAFRSGADLEQAYLRTSGVNEDFDSVCNAAQRNLRQANSLAADVEFDENKVQLVSSITKQAIRLQKFVED